MEHSTIAALACLLVPGRVIEKAHIYSAAHDFYAVKSRFQIGEKGTTNKGLCFIKDGIFTVTATWTDPEGSFGQDDSVI